MHCRPKYNRVPALSQVFLGMKRSLWYDHAHWGIWLLFLPIVTIHLSLSWLVLIVIALTARHESRGSSPRKIRCLWLDRAVHMSLMHCFKKVAPITYRYITRKVLHKSFSSITCTSQVSSLSPRNTLKSQKIHNSSRLGTMSPIPKILLLGGLDL